MPAISATIITHNEEANIARAIRSLSCADEIVVMDRGRIIGQGSHEGLMGSCETYQQLYERQMVMAPAGE